MKYDADIVISSAGIKCLIDNHGPHFDRQWELPVVIKEYKVQGMMEASPDPVNIVRLVGQSARGVSRDVIFLTSQLG